MPKCGMQRASDVCMGAKTFEELFAWQCCSALRDKVVAVCATAPLQKDLDFRNQLRRAACAELMEVQSDLIDLEGRHLVTEECVTELKTLADRALRITTRLRSSLKD